MRARRAARLALVLPALVLAAGQAPAQRLADKTKPRNHPVNCPYTGGDPQLLAKAGIISLGGFDFGTQASTADLDAYLAVNDVKWVETEHFKIGMALGPYKITQKEKKKLLAELERLAVFWPETVIPKKIRTLDPWLRAYLFALRAEDLWDQILELLDVDESAFPDGSAPWNTLGKYMGMGPYLGQKGKYEVLFLPSEAGSAAYLRHFFGLRTRRTQRWNIVDKDTLHLVIHTQQGQFRKDIALHGHFVFNQTIQMLNAYKHYSYEIPTWIKEGIGHWMERRVSPKYNSFDGSEGNVPRMTSKENWEPPTRSLVAKREAVTMAQLINLKGFADMELDHHFTSWSMVDYLIREHPEFLPQLLDRIKGMLDEQFIDDGSGLDDVHRAAFRELLGMTYAQFDRAWGEWVLANYSAQ